ncbi:response regulator [Tepidibacillus infernus]|uniref:response regulator n=1 Tax=Tepidibacillus infernus TaxID=1806172 RepID=UPI003A38409A
MVYKVLIIEDDFRIAEINKSFVSQVEGFEIVDIALNGKTALQLLQQHQPDLVLLDVYIPDISGEELFLHIKDAYPQIDVIMITAAKEVKTLEVFLRHGIFDYLVKPVRIERLHKSLNKYHWYKQKLAKETELDQTEIDAIMGRSIHLEHQSEHYPKGIDPLTLERVRRFLNKEGSVFTAEEIGKELGIGRSTARRYLEFLVNKGEIMVDLRYGTVGRPERIYGHL